MMSSQLLEFYDHNTWSQLTVIYSLLSIPIMMSSHLLGFYDQDKLSEMTFLYSLVGLPNDVFPPIGVL